MDLKVTESVISETKTDCKKNRQRPDSLMWRGCLKYQINKTSHLADGRFRTRVALCDPENEREVLENVTIDAMSLEQLEIKTQEKIFQLQKTHQEELLKKMARNRFPNATLGLYRDLRYDDVRIKARWAGKTAEYDALWEQILKAKFENIPLKELAFFERTKNEMDILFNHARHQKASEKEKKCWLQLSAFYDALVSDKILPLNPIKDHTAKYRHSMTADVLKNLSARSLSREELLKYVKACLCIEDSSLRTCMLIHVLLGLTVYELCGLDINSFAYLEDLSWLEISKACYQKRGEEPKITEMLNSANQYRKVICSDVVAFFLAQHVKQRLADGAKRTDPMFVEQGERLRPQSVKKAENALVDEVMAQGIHITHKGRGRPHKNGRDRARTDILRGTAVYNFKYTSKMTLVQIAVMCGIDRIHTYAIWYVDWNNLEVMRYMKKKVSQWHGEIFSLNPRSKKGPQFRTEPGERKGVFLRIVAEPHGSLELQAACGMEGAVAQTHAVLQKEDYDVK